MKRKTRMRRLWLVVATVVVAFGADGRAGAMRDQTGATARANTSAAVQLEAAIKKEIDGDLKAAIEMYRKVAASSDRAVAAQALLRMAGCQEKLGQSDAQKTYQQVIAQFADQPAAVAEARKRIGPRESQAGAGPFRTRPTDTNVGVLSPDGTLALDVREGKRLIERNLATGTERTVVDATADLDPRFPPEFSGNFGPLGGALLWSPDGTMIAFVRRGVGDKPARVQVLVRSTGEVRTVAQAGPGQGIGPAAWTTKGEVLYSTWGTAGPAPLVFEYRLVSSVGGEPRRILSQLKLTNTLGPDRDLFGDLTPDGTRAIVIKSEHLTVIDVATGTETAITLGVGVASPKVSPDGRLLAFLSKQKSTWGLYVAPLDRLPIRNPVLVANLTIEGNPEIWRRPRWTGRDTLAYDYYAGVDNVYRIEMDPKTAKPIGMPEQLSHQFAGYKPMIAPDGRHIAYSSADGGVIVMDADGSRARRMTEPGTPVAGNGLRGWKTADEILFVNRHQQDGHAGSIRVVNIKTGDVSLLSDGISVLTEPNWQYLIARNEIFYRARSADTIVARSLVDGTEKTVFTLPGLGSWRASTDGRQIFACNRAANGDFEFAVYQVGPPSGTTAPAPFFRAPIAHLPSVGAWAPDGAHVLYSANDELRVLDVRTGQSWSPFDDRANKNAFLDPDTEWTWDSEGSWAPDGSWVAAAIWSTRTFRLAFEGVTYDAVTKAMARRAAGTSR